MGWLRPHLVVPNLPLPIKSWKRKHLLDDLAGKLDHEVGKRTVSGRFHRAPRQIQDDYELTDTVLGSGFNGDVHMATLHSHPGQKVAVKVLPLGSIAKSKLLQFKSEVENFLRMDHPHITRLLDVYESKDSLALVMECMEGGELFDRLAEIKRFSEEDAAEALWQMLLALNYIHSHGVVHRDVKLENFLYDKKGSKHLKLIDFGFSKRWNAKHKMDAGLGTIAYVAPEVLKQSYTSQCDLWSLGVIGFVLLSGYMPFSGSGKTQIRSIMSGNFRLKPERWETVSEEAGSFVRSLLEVDPRIRLTAKAALEHPFIARHQAKAPRIDAGVVQALQQFGHTSKFRRCCLEMMAWSLSSEQLDKVREHFLSLDTSMEGTITMGELRCAMDTLGISDETEVQHVFEALDSNEDHEIHFSDFLAAMVSTKIDLDEDLMEAAFRKFDLHNSGYITSTDLREVVGETFEGEHVEALLKEASQGEYLLDSHGDHPEGHKDGLSYPEFADFLRRSSKSLPEESPQHLSCRGGECIQVRSEKLNSKFRCMMSGLSMLVCKGMLLN